MASFGKNVKITVDDKHRARTRQVFTEALGCAVKNPAPDLEVYVFEDGAGIGAYYVDASRALAESDQVKAPWLELLVADVDRTHDKLAELDVHPFDYADKAHRYYRVPGGPVFRLAKQG